MDRMSVFYPADNEAGHIQAVIARKDFAEFEKLGFVKTTDDLKPAKSTKKAGKDGDDANKG